MTHPRPIFRTAATVFWVAVTIIPIIGIVLSLTDPVKFYDTQEQYRAFSSRYGAWAPVAFILLQALQVVITPISHYSVGYMGGFLFGPLLGGLYNYVGRLCGHLMAFSLSRFGAYRLVARVVPHSTLLKYDSFVNQPMILFLIYFLPFFPDDEIS